MDYFESVVQNLDNEFNKLFRGKEPKNLYEAMSYSVLAGGKRLRPVLLIAACECFGGDINYAMPFAVAVELIHTYSLIHDDLPAMDNDDLRRGKPTNHIVYGEAMAILAGDGLLNMAYEIMSHFCAENDEIKYVNAMKEIAAAAGANGMVGGQAVDILSEGIEISGDVLEYIHKHKTASMICASLAAGAIVGGADPGDVERFRKVGNLIGFAFQVQDDILDYKGDEIKVGKSLGGDERNKKTTYISLHGIDKATADFEKDFNCAIEILRKVKNTENLIEIVKNVLHRDK
ncbi:MAG: polyprenyl synthetase family protein [Defluviitaleaceae bacterium]|nr:polyprenyl synthetase family protein [Defluviitaleaceae bacterium]